MAALQSHPSEGTVSFTRTITPADETALAIPPDFQRTCFDRVPRKLWVWAEDMIQTEVKVELRDGSYYLVEGWSEFMVRYGIQLQEKLTFHWLGRENLFVTVYGHNEVRRVPERLTFGSQDDTQSSALFNSREYRERLLRFQAPSPLISSETDYKYLDSGKGKRKRKATSLDDDESFRSDASFPSKAGPKVPNHCPVEMDSSYRQNLPISFIDAHVKPGRYAIQLSFEGKKVYAVTLDYEEDEPPRFTDGWRELAIETNMTRGDRFLLVVQDMSEYKWVVYRLPPE